MTHRVVLDELDREGRLADLTDEEAQSVAAAGLVTVRPERAGWRLLPNGHVGTVRTSRLQVDVLPKEAVGLTDVMFLLGYARDPGFRPEYVSGAESDDLLPAIAHTLLRLSRTALGAGILQGYRTVEEALPTVRGRIRLSDQLSRRPALPLPVEVVHDEFTQDIAENQILRTAIRRMLAVPRIAEEVRRELGHLDGRLSGVRVLAVRERRPDWSPSRLNARYVPALRVAELVLDRMSVDLGVGRSPMTAFVVDMASVYEDFVATALSEALLPYPGSTRSQYPARLDVVNPESGPGISMRVDVVHVVSHTPAIVFDAKYIASGPRGYPNANHYQLLAYCTALDVPVGWLVYAGKGPTREYRIANTDITIVEYALDLSMRPEELLRRVERLAGVAWGRWAPIAAA